MCFVEDSTLEQDYVTKYFIKRRNGNSGLYLARQRIPTREIRNRDGYQGIPSSVTVPKPTYHPRPQQVFPPSQRTRYGPGEFENKQPIFENGSEASTTEISWTGTTLGNDANVRRVRFSLPEAPDVVYPGGKENLRILREQFDGISEQEEDWPGRSWRRVPSQIQEDGYDEPELAIPGEYSFQHRQEPIPKGILKNWSAPTPAIPSPVYNQNPNQMSKNFYYLPPQDDDSKSDRPQPIRRLRILCPPPLPEREVLYGSEKEARANRHVRFNVGWADSQENLPSRNNPTPSQPPVPPEQNVSWQSPNGWHEPMKPVPAYVRSEEEEGQNQLGSVEW
ncbi:hypothetical protein FQN54_009849 [Arachnomyces sp. PD_36]|nr:hypothetical protein FQN54_009849 [Arachnomyces sp. PD_36]